MKIAASQLIDAEAALSAVLPMTQPADAVLSQFFRAHPRIGQHDRAFIADTVFAILRSRYSLEYYTGADSARRLLLAYFNRGQGVSLRQLDALCGREDAQWAAAAKTRPRTPPPLNVAAELPEWTVALLSKEMSDADILAIGRSLAQAAPLDLRVNTLRAKRSDVLASFAAENIPAQATPYAPLGIRLGIKPAINRHVLFTSGAFEVQDEGSQIVCHLLGPKRREMVVDFCAGAGGKTLALGALMQSTGRLYALDVSEARLDRLKPRLKRSGLSNVHPQLLDGENDTRVKRLAGKIDRVLVDAPCSGFGTLRRNPDLKWRQSPRDVAELAEKQYSIIAAAAQMLKRGGRLVYATCSILRAENQDIVERFLSEHRNFGILSANAVLQAQHIALDTRQFLELRPDRHGCDGFFAAAMERHS